MVIAALSLVNLVARPRFLTYNALDVIQTAGIGVCFGAAIMVLVGTSRKPMTMDGI